MELASSSLSTPTSQRYFYTPLPDASTYIRLLRVCFTATKDIPDTFEMTEHPMNDLPEYAAISYVWGTETERHTIYINESWMEITTNAWFALKQACDSNRANRDPEKDDSDPTYLWIDSVCINQQDLAEKSAQVEMMAEIYKMAIVVYACVGPHDHESELLIEVFDALRDIDLASHALLNGEDVDNEDDGEEEEEADYSLEVEWLMSQEGERIYDICGAFARFANRRYWSRMWIVQELCMGDDCAILCGDDVFAIEDLRLFEHVFEALLEEELSVEKRVIIEAEYVHMEAGFMYRAINNDQSSQDRLGFALDRMKDFRCSDPRDRIYAQNAMIQWGEGQSRLKPDYKKSAFDVLVQAVGHVRASEDDLNMIGFPESICERVRLGVLEAVGVGASDPQMRSGVAERQRQPSIARRASPAATRSLLREQSYAFSRIASDQRGRLCANFHQVIRDQSEESIELLHILNTLEKNFSASTSGLVGSNTPRRLYVGPAVAGLICSDTQSGDYLYPFDVSRAITERECQLYIVIRYSSSSQTCLIVGQAIIFVQYEPNEKFFTWDELETSRFTLMSSPPIFELTLTAEDLVVLMGQDFAIDTSSSWPGHPLPGHSLPRPRKYDIEARFQRLITSVTISPECGARLVKDTCGTEELCALRIASTFASTVRSAGSREKEEFRLSQTGTGFAFMANSIPMYCFAGPFTRPRSGEPCPIHISASQSRRLVERHIFEGDIQRDATRWMECTCHLMREV